MNKTKIVGFAALAGAAYFAGLYAFFRKNLGRCDKFPNLYSEKDLKKFNVPEKNLGQMRKGSRFVSEHTTEEVYIRSFDGLRLYARIVENPNPTGTVIFFHGFRSCTDFDFSVVFEDYYKRGYNLICVTQRAHGKSEGKFISMGIYERYDCKSWAEYAAKRFGKDSPIILEGLSMGASTVLMASDLPMPENVKGIIADCGYTTPDDIFLHVGRDIYGLPPFPFMTTFRRYFRHFIHANTTDASSIESLKRTKLPVLLIHGKADDFVPYSMSEENDAACASRHAFVFVDGAGHGQSYLFDREKCDKALEEFLESLK